MQPYLYVISPHRGLNQTITSPEDLQLVQEWDPDNHPSHLQPNQDQSDRPSYSTYYPDNYYAAADHAYVAAAAAAGSSSSDSRIQSGESVGNAVVTSMVTLANGTAPAPEYGAGDGAYGASGYGGYVYLSNNNNTHPCTSSGNFEAGSEQDVRPHYADYSFADFVSDEDIHFADGNPGHRGPVEGAAASQEMYLRSSMRAAEREETNSDSAVYSMGSERVSSRESFCFSDEESQASRDERRARALNIPIPTEAIINLPIDEFNELLSRHTLTEAQLSLIRDIRRRGKNKVAAQNCRKRKMDQIMGLQGEVHRMYSRKEALEAQHQQLLAARHLARERYSKLYQFLVDSSSHGP